VLVFGVVRLGGSAGGGWECFELRERGRELAGPQPVVLEAQAGAAAVEREPAGDVQQPYRSRLGSAFEERALEQQRLGPGEQVVRHLHELEPHLVVLEVFERELLTAVSLSSRIWFSTRARSRWRRSRTAMSGSVSVGEEALEAVAVVVGE
jgi:hypothetical protein